MLQHGIHLGQQAEMVTDGLRALLLEAEGYATAGVRVRRARAHQQEQDDPGREAAAQGRSGGDPEAQIREIKAFYGVREHCLETLLAARPGGRRAHSPQPA